MFFGPFFGSRALQNHFSVHKIVLKIKMERTLINKNKKKSKKIYLFNNFFSLLKAQTI